MRTCSPAQAWEVFTRTRITEARWAEASLDLLADADLYCCIGESAYPWTEAAPAVLGCLAFGTPWQANVGPGIQLAVPKLRPTASDASQVLKPSTKAPGQCSVWQTPLRSSLDPWLALVHLLMDNSADSPR